jgi:hypothetical protein
VIKVNFRDGRTASYDLETEHDSERWEEVISDPIRTAQITGMAIHMHGILLTLPKPQGQHAFGADLLVSRNGSLISGERIYCDLPGSRLEVVCYRDQKLVRVDHKTRGIRRYDPRSVLDRRTDR